MSDFRGSTSLEVFNLSSNHLAGIISSTLAILPSLRVLYLSDNFLCGKVPCFRNNMTLQGTKKLRALVDLTYILLSPGEIVMNNGFS